MTHPPPSFPQTIMNFNHKFEFPAQLGFISCLSYFLKAFHILISFLLARKKEKASCFHMNSSPDSVMWDSMICLINHIIRYSKNTFSTHFCHEPLTILFSFDLFAWKVSNFGSADPLMSSKSCSNRVQFIFVVGPQDFFETSSSGRTWATSCSLWHACTAAMPPLLQTAGPRNGLGGSCLYCTLLQLGFWSHQLWDHKYVLGCGAHLTQSLIDTV